MPDYAKGKIYRIDSQNGSHDLCYIGSTTETLEFRLYMHEHQYVHYLKPTSKSSCISAYQVIATGDYKVTLIEEYLCASKKNWKNARAFTKGRLNA